MFIEISKIYALTLPYINTQFLHPGGAVSCNDIRVSEQTLHERTNLLGFCGIGIAFQNARNGSHQNSIETKMAIVYIIQNAER